MFSALSQGSSVYILDKTSSPKYFIGEVVGVSQPRISYGSTTVDLKLKIEDSIKEFNNISSISNLVTYEGGKIILSETKQGIQNEVEQVLQNRRYAVENVEKYKQDIVDYESILKKLNPQFAVDKERDERLSNLESKFDGIESKLDKIFNLIQK